MPGMSKPGIPPVSGTLNLDLLVVEFAVAKLFAEGLARRRARICPDKRIQDPFLRLQMRFRPDLFALVDANEADGHLDKVADDLIHVAADIADLGEFRCLDLNEWGVCELASLREISVLPTPVGPIMRMFSVVPPRACPRRVAACASDCEAQWRRRAWRPLVQRCSGRVRKRFRAGRNLSFLAFRPAPSGTLSLLDRGGQAFDNDVIVGVNADVRRDGHRFAGDLLGGEIRFEKGASGRERIISAGSDAHDMAVGFQNVAGAGENEGRVLVRDDHHRLQPAQVAVGAPVLG